MGQRGPSPEPIAIKIAKGTATPEQEATVMAEAGTPEMPSIVARAGEKAVEVWHETVERLSQRDGLLSPIDARALAIYCIAWQRCEDAEDEIARDGITCMGEKGGQYPHPAVGIQNKALDTITRIGAKFGMTASDRVGLPVGNGSAGKKGVRRRQA